MIQLAKRAVRKEKWPGGRPAREEAARRIEYLLDCAMKMFVEHGYLATTIAGIAKQSRMSKKTIYARFPDKAALFTKVAERVAGFVELERLDDHDAANYEEGLYRLVKGLLEDAFTPATFALFRLWQREGHLIPELNGIYRKITHERRLAPLVRFWEMLQQAGIAAPQDPAFVANAILNLIEGEIRDVALGVSLIPDENRVAIITRNICHIILNGALKSTKS